MSAKPKADGGAASSPATTPNRHALIYLDPNTLVKLPGNSKRHPPEQIGKLAASIRAFGFCQPILIDENAMVLAGHGRMEAAIQLGVVEVPAVVLAGLTETQKRAYAIADNRLAEMGEWDFGLLHQEMELIEDEGFDLGVTGFNIKDLGIVDEENDADGKTPGFTIPGEDETDIIVTVPNEHADEVRKWLADGERLTGRGFGRGIQRRMGLIAGGAEKRKGPAVDVAMPDDAEW